MASTKGGVKPINRNKHLRDGKRAQNKKIRAAGKRIS